RSLPYALPPRELHHGRRDAGGRHGRKPRTPDGGSAEPVGSPSYVERATPQQLWAVMAARKRDSLAAKLKHRSESVHRS
ncbi:MAG: hypothetical protein QXI90_07815, partial [Thermofilum sp.]